MNKDEFMGYLQHPEKLDANSVSDLNGLINEFPYCQSARILLTLNLFGEKNVKYDSELKTTAVYASNRGLLRKHIERLSTENAKVALPDEDVVDKQEQKQEIEDIPDDNIEQKDEVKKGETPEITPEDEPKVESEVKKPQANVEDEAANIAEVKDIISRHIGELEAENELKRKKASVTEETRGPVKAKSDLVDDFIKNEPSISRPKVKFYDPVNKARESIVDNENIVSETLAGIFHDQGHLLKAIKIYQKLSLKFPEKSSYFAALIEKAEKELES